MLQFAQAFEKYDYFAGRSSQRTPRAINLARKTALGIKVAKKYASHSFVKNGAFWLLPRILRSDNREWDDLLHGQHKNGRGSLRNYAKTKVDDFDLVSQHTVGPWQVPR